MMDTKEWLDQVEIESGVVALIADVVHSNPHDPHEEVPC